MKSRILAFIIGAAVVCSLNSCDWVKKQLGMATSEDIAKLKMEMEQQALREKQIKDSLEAVRLDSLRMAQEAAATPYAKLDKQYYLITGSYKEVANAENMQAQLKKLGYAPVRIKLRNGFDMVAAIGTDDLGEACRELNKIGDHDICTYDVWIYNVNQGLHEN